MERPVGAEGETRRNRGTLPQPDRCLELPVRVPKDVACYAGFSTRETLTACNPFAPCSTSN